MTYAYGCHGAHDNYNTINVLWCRDWIEIGLNVVISCSLMNYCVYMMSEHICHKVISRLCAELRVLV